MMKIKFMFKLLMISLLSGFSLSGFAGLSADNTSGVQIKGTVYFRVPLSRAAQDADTFGITLTEKKLYKEISLMRLSFSDLFLKKFSEKAKKISSESVAKLSEDPTFDPSDFDVDLGMNGVPVLDQGQYGTCVTFANTAAIDATNHLGDFVSQQCNLELGVTLAKENVINDSGWNGSYGKAVLTQMNDYGVVSKSQCPDKYADASLSISEDDFALMSKYSHTILWNDLTAGDVDAVIDALKNHHWVTIGTLIPYNQIVGYPVNGKSNGLWTLQYEDDLDNVCELHGCGGHEIVITGYDSKDKVFKIRNSWGADVGDSGEYYMTYQYYELMDMEAFEIQPQA